MNTFDFATAFRAAASLDFADVPDEKNIKWTFSPQFLRKIKKLNVANRLGYWQFINNTSKRIACVVAILILLTSVVVRIEPVRRTVLEFFVELYDRFSVITYGEERTAVGSETESTMPRYTFSVLPEGFVEVEFQDLTLFYRTIYSNKNEEEIILEQSNGQEVITLDKELADTAVVQSESGVEVICYSLENSVTLIWTQDSYSFNMTCSGKLTVDQALQLIDTLVLKKTE